MTIGAGGQLDIALQILTEALTVYDGALPPLADDLLIPSAHYKYRAPWQRGRSLGAELTDFIDRRDPLATFACFELSSSSKYLFIILQYLCHASNFPEELERRKASVLELHAQGNARAALHFHLWECVGFMALAITAIRDWAKKHQERARLDISFRQWLQCSYAAFHLEDWATCSYSLCMAIKVRDTDDDRNELLWETVIFMCASMERSSSSSSNSNNKPSSTTSYVNDAVAAASKLIAVLQGLPTNMLRWCLILEHLHPGTMKRMGLEVPQTFRLEPAEESDNDEPL